MTGVAAGRGCDAGSLEFVSRGAATRTRHLSLGGVPELLGASLASACEAKQAPASRHRARARPVEPRRFAGRGAWTLASVAVARDVLRAVIGCFLRNRDVMWMTLPYARRGDLDEAGFGA